MLTAEENELLTRVGPGTPCGELMRRYWHPLADAVARDLKLGELAAVSGTPSMFINGERVLNPMDYEALASMIDRKLGDGS